MKVKARPERADYHASSAEVAELADAPDSKSGSLRGVWVRFPPSAPEPGLRARGAPGPAWPAATAGSSRSRAAAPRSASRSSGPGPSGSIVDRTAACQERRDLLLRREGERPRRTRDVAQERVRVLDRVARDGREGEVVPEVRRPVLEPAGTDERRRRRVRHGLVALRELDDHRLRRRAGQRLRPDVRRPRDGIRRRLRPDVVVEHVLDRVSARHRVDEDRLAAERHVLVEVRERRVRHRVVERRHASRERDPDERPERRRQPRDLGDRAARDVHDARVHCRLDAEERRAVDAAERLAEVRDLRRVEIGAPSPFTSTPTWISRTSCMRSITVWRRPSRLPTGDERRAALTPSVESIVPLPSWSMPRPPAENVTGGPSLREPRCTSRAGRRRGRRR